MTGTAIVSYEDRFAKDAAAAAEREARSAPSLSTAGGVFSLAGQVLGPTIACVIIDAFFENNFFHPNIAFDRDNLMPPVCYAFSRDKKALSPHESMRAAPDWFRPQHFPCDGCPQNVWGSSPRGKGKACQNRERLTLLPAGYYQSPGPRKPPELTLIEDPAHYEKVDSVTLRLPVTSGENWSKYVTQLFGAHRRPSYAVYTEITLAPDPVSQFKATFDLIDLCGDNLFDILIRRMETVVAAPFPAFNPPSAEQLEAAANPPKQQRGGFRR